MNEDGLVPKDTRVLKCEYCGKIYGQGEIAQHTLHRHIQLNHLRKYSLLHTYNMKEEFHKYNISKLIITLK